MTPPPRPRDRTLPPGWQVASLESLLPLSETSSVFVRVDETAVQLWKAIIVGPEDTPYSGGCFVFDIYFPPQYPNAPPQVSGMPSASLPVLPTLCCPALGFRPRAA